jgi:hypothetical protein
MNTTAKIIIGGTVLTGSAALAYYFFVYRQSNQNAKSAIDTINQTSSVVANTKPTSAYPSLIEMLQAAQQGKWESVEPGAIVASYNPDTGTWQRGDWKFKVSSLRPIKADAFKGSEHYVLTSPVNSQATGMAGISGIDKLNDFDMTTNLRGLAISSDTLSQINQTTSQLPQKKTLLDYINTANTYVDKGSTLVNKVQDQVSNYIGTGNNVANFVQQQNNTSQNGNNDPKPSGLSTAAKVGIAAAGVGLVGIIIYALVPKDKEEAKA